MKSHLVFGLNIFIGAFLVFFIQPTSAKALLPDYGGSAFVWIASVLFFQLSLFVGYLYAYLLDKCFKVKVQAIIHFVLLGLSLSFLPITIISPNTDISSPVLQIVHSLILSILLPMILVSATSPLLQHWYYHLKQSRFPYKFYAVSNAGSLIGLLGFPFLLELWLDVPSLFNLWSLVFVCFMGLSIVCCFMVYKPEQVKRHTIVASLPLDQLPIWIGLAFLGSALLVGSTFYVTQNLINMPLLWVAPLALYLLSFILSFSDALPSKRAFWYHNFIVWLILYAWMLSRHNINGFDIIIVLFTLMFSGMMVAHNVLYQTRPHPQHLTMFYLMIALGGMVGGLFVNLITMTGLTYWWDLYIPLLGIGCLVLGYVTKSYRTNANTWTLLGLSSGIIMLPVFCIAMAVHMSNTSANEIFRHRNFYGILSVIEQDGSLDIGLRQLRHGSIIHGFQFLDSNKRTIPTTYYTQTSGIGAVFHYLHQHQGPIKVGAIGLGTGTIAALGKPGDSFDFFEIDRDIIQVGQQYFSFLSDSPASYTIYDGDGRMLLQDIADRSDEPIYDLIVVDAFSGDTIPFHLMTAEALNLYRSLLKPKGMIAFHISNTYLNLAHVTHSLAKDALMQHDWVYNESNSSNGAFAADWIILSQDPFMRTWLQQSQYNLISNKSLKQIVWTDNNNSLLPLMRLKSKS